MSEVNNNIIAIIKFCTNNINDNQIYDFRSSVRKESVAYISKETYIVQNKNKTMNFKYQQADVKEEEELFLFRIIIDRDEDKYNYSIVNLIADNLRYRKYNIDYINNKIWYVIRPEVTQKNKEYNADYYLNVNDMIKIGKVQYVVKEIHLMKGNIDPDNLNCAAPISDYNISDINKDKGPVFDFVYKIKKDSYIIVNQKTLSHSNKTPAGSDDNQKGDISQNNSNNEKDEKKPKCIFCQSEKDEDNLISLCKCKKYMHYKCAKAYIKNSIERNKRSNNNGVDCMIIKDFKCSGCGMYPTRFQLPDSDEVYELIEYNKPTDCDYMILESLPHIISDQYYKIIYIIRLKEYITIGRHLTNDIVLEDISSSKYHAVMKYNKDDGKICIQDKNSKYGTLVLVRGPILMLYKKLLMLQVANIYIEALLTDKTEYDTIKDKYHLNENIEINKEKNIFINNINNISNKGDNEGDKKKEGIINYISFYN